MSFRELIKGAAHRYVKRVPKAGGGYKYYYKEHHGGGVTAQKHFKEGAAFKLTHNGQEGHFHITEAGEGELKVRHDESGREVTLSPDDLEALLRAQHGAALEDNARQKRAKAEKLKRTKPDSLAAAAAEKRAEVAEAKAGDEPATKPAQEQEPRPNNFETMPESTSDYTREGSAFSSSARAALNRDIGEALLKGDADKVEELKGHRDREALYTGAPAVDTLMSELIKDAKTTEAADGTETAQASAQLTEAQRETLEAAVESGHLIKQTARDGLITYRAAPARAALSPSNTWRLAVRGGASTLTLNHFEQSAERPAAEVDEEAKAPRDPAKVESVLSQIEELIKSSPELANDPRVMAILGSQGSAPKTEGHTAPLFITGIKNEETAQEAQYQLMEAGDLIASHDPLSFAQREDYPEGIQERDYHQSQSEQLKVERNAANLEPAYLINSNPDATNGPPIITPEGHVLGGNSRAMSLQLAYGRGGERGRRYKETLTQQAAAYGFTAADVSALKAPVLVRVYKPTDSSKEHLTKLVRAMNESKTQGMEARIQGRALAGKLSTNTLKTIKEEAAKYPQFTLNRFLTRPTTGLTEVVRALRRDQVITAENAPQLLREDGSLTGNGREMIQQMLVGYVIRDEKILKAMDFQTYENLTAAVGKLAAAGLGDQAKRALESAVVVYDTAVRRDLITARGSAQSRQDGILHLLNERALEGIGASAGDTDTEAHKRAVLTDPLAAAFLQIFTTNKGSSGIEESVERLLDLTTAKEQLDMFSTNEPLSFEEGARKVARELAEANDLQEKRLFTDIEKERVDQEEARAKAEQERASSALL